MIFALKYIDREGYETTKFQLQTPSLSAPTGNPFFLKSHKKNGKLTLEKTLLYSEVFSCAQFTHFTVLDFQGSLRLNYVPGFLLVNTKKVMTSIDYIFMKYYPSRFG